MVAESQYRGVTGGPAQVIPTGVLVTALMTLAYVVNFMNQGIILVVAVQL